MQTKRTRGKRCFALCMSMLLMFSMCDGITGQAEEKEENPLTMKSSLSMTVGGKKTLSVSGTKEKVKWSSSNKKVASITSTGNRKGKIEAKKDGSTVVTAKVADRKVSCKVTVKNKEIRVLLKSSGFGSSTHGNVVVTSNKKFTVTNGKKVKEYKAGKKVTISTKSALLKNASSVTVEAEKNGKIKICSIRRTQGNPSYRGKIIIRKSGSKVALINQVPLEEYLYSVVASEMSPSSSLEALKAQAVTARSFAYSHLGAYKKYNADVDDSTNYQVYNNFAETKKTRKAVDETENKVLKNGSKIISTYYFSTSFGQTSKPSEVWGSARVDKYYKSIEQKKGGKQKNLSSEKAFQSFIKSSADNFDKKSPWYRWKVTMSKKSFQKLINSRLASYSAAYPGSVKTKQKNGSYKSQKITTVGELKEVKIVSRKRSGMVQTLQITGKKKTVRIYSAQVIRTFLGPRSSASLVKKNGEKVSGLYQLPSVFFYVGKSGKNYVVSGGGYGHGVGMSQTGANEMGKRGYSFNSILHHYFSNVKICHFAKKA